MAYLERILRALSAGDLDPKRFEETACALLGELYPGLSPIEGGTDFGRDADVYEVNAGFAVHAGDEPVPVGTVSVRLLATVGDPIANLTRSIARLKEESLATRQLVIACTLPVSATKRRALEVTCMNNGLELPAIYGRDKLAALLLKAPTWTEYFLGIRGRVGALEERRFVRGDHVSLPLFGRALQLESLTGALAGGGDVLLTGIAGIGKSRLLDELGEVHFLNPMAIDSLVADLFVVDPVIVVVDDAHLHLDALEQLCRVRVVEGMTFAVLAVTWPAQAAAVRQILQSPALVEVRELPRDAMDELTRGVGVSGVNARHFVLHHAEGRPGWAVSIAQTLIAADGEAVLTGDVLLQQVDRYFRDRAESHQLMDAVAHIAALRFVGTDDLPDIATVVGLPVAVMSAALRQVATDGLLVHEGERWSLQPSLGAALVARWFLSSARTRSWRSLTETFPEKEHDLTSSMLEAAASTGDVAAVMHSREWAASLGEPTTWTLETLGLVRTYSEVDREASEFAACRAALILDMPRSPRTTPWGRAYDPIADAARAQLLFSARRWFTGAAVRKLLDLAVPDDRERAQTPDHPMRVLAEVAQHLGPDAERNFEVRRLLLDEATTWLTDGLLVGARVAVWSEAIKACCWPRISGSWKDPSSLTTFTWSTGTEGHLALEWILDNLWHQASAQLAHLALPVEAVGHLLDLWDEWLHVAAGVAQGNYELNDDQRNAGTQGTWRILAPLRIHVDHHAGLAYRVTQQLDHCHRWGIDIPDGVQYPPMDHDLAQLVGRRDFSEGDVGLWMERRDEEVRDLAERLSVMSPSDAIARITELAEAAAVAGRGEVGALAYQLAEAVNAPAEWLRVALERDAPDLIGPLVARCRTAGDSSCDELIGRHLKASPSARRQIIAAVLRSGPCDALAKTVLDSLVSADAATIEFALPRQATETVLAMLTHSMPEIAGLTALQFDVGTTHSINIPDHARDAWRTAFLNSASLSARTAGISSYRISSALKALATDDPDLCEAWFHQALAHDRRPHDLEQSAEVLSRLHRDARKRLATNHHAAYSLTGDVLLLNMIGHDPDLAAEMLDEGLLNIDTILAALTGNLNHYAHNLLPVTLAFGAQVEDVVSALTSSRSWEGNESDDLARMIKWFNDAATRIPAMKPVSAEANKQLERQRAKALEEERQQAIRGTF
ncbi:ATP-binding protein [Nocardioides plantarum]|uniref:ATP-binding protein n=1 Tax=Nocardioides plantarum TaxID=29299 RepID=A0ABV5KJC2_9ACTN|nr:ATP-binding protein [Nocardioides plantarum]